MTGRAQRFLGLRLVVSLVVLALWAGSCTGGNVEAPEASDGVAGEGATLEHYRVAILEDTTTDNFWAFLDTEAKGSNGYLLVDTKPNFFDVAYPINDDVTAGGVIIPDLSAGPPAEPVQRGDVWVVEQSIRQGLRWSDGKEITAQDFVFTVNTVHEFNLGGNWLSIYPEADENAQEGVGIVRVEAVDAYTVRITFNRAPGLELWPYTMGVSGPWMPEHFWAAAVEEARDSADPAQTLYAASGIGDPSGGPMVFDSREPGAFARRVANTHFHNKDRVITLYESGTVGVTGSDGKEELFGGKEADSAVIRYRTGPFVERQTLTLYSSHDAAVIALRRGEIDFLPSESGLQGAPGQVLDDPDLEAAVNPAYGMRFLGFNLRRFPTNHKAFRQALAMMIDREFMATNVLQGAAFPLYTMMPPGNAKWFNEDVAAELQRRYGAGLDEAERLAEAVRILENGGFSWATAPSYDAQLNAVKPGTGLVGPGGQPIPPLELLAPDSGADPLRATYAIWVERWARNLGIPLSTNPTSQDTIRSRLYTSGGEEPQFDLVIDRWSLGTPAFPIFYDALWHSRHDTKVSGGFNAPGFANPEFDRLAEAYRSTRSEEDAFEFVWEMERILAEELPYIVLFNPPILDFYRSEAVQYPFTDMLGGLQFIGGAPELVMAAS